MTATTADRRTDSAGDALARLEILELTSSLGLLVDAGDWDALRQLFTDPVDIDYTSLNGGEPQTLSPTDLIQGWRGVLDGLHATQHLIAGHVIAVDGDQATCAANVQATHLLPNASGGPLWTVAGRYDYGLTRTPSGWRISALKLTVQWAAGNQHIVQLATAEQ